MDADIFLCKIGEQVLENILVDPKTQFIYNGKIWQLFKFLYSDAASIIQFVNGVNDSLKCIKFAETYSHDNRNILVAIYVQNLYNEKTCSTVKRFFPLVLNNYFDYWDQPILNTNTELGITDEANGDYKNEKLKKKYITTKFYNALYNIHEKYNTVINQDIELDLPIQFKPLLRHYQKRTVKWLLQRETHKENWSEIMEKLIAKDGESIVYKHNLCFYFQNEAPSNIDLHPGGILADEMGLGKTVEILALILLHPPNSLVVSNVNEFKKKQNEKNEITSKIKKVIPKTVFCICSNKNKTKVIQCNSCSRLQHAKCVTKYNKHHENKINDFYYCPECWHTQSKLELFKSKATLIITPSSIKRQWVSEIERHINPSLRVFLYDGVKCWISPRQLAVYDIVLTDYNILRKDFHFTTDAPSRVTRNKPRSMRVYSPLLMVQWWRLCVDEAQMVESNTSKIAALAQRIPAINRWAVTGTPIHRSIDDLNPLLRFIGFEQLCDPPVIWHNLINNLLQQHNIEDSLLVKIIYKCMWRTCKSKVLDELQIPPQTEVVHTINMSNIERLFYTEEHNECTQKFIETVNKYIESSVGVYLISPQIMKLILMPLLKIRQCCTIPVVVGGKQTNSTNKQFLQPKELHAHLKSANEIKCKAELRTMVSSYNGMAGLYFIQKNYSEAIRRYELVLKLAKDYNSMNITVDSLLQIHALYNILQAHYISGRNDLLSKETVERYEEDCNKLEWKYLEPYANELSSVENGFQLAVDSLNRITNETGTNLMEFLANIAMQICYKDSNMQDFIIAKMRDESFTQYSSNAKYRKMTSISSFLYIIDIWFKKLNELQNDLFLKFHELNFFTKNIRSRSQVTPAVWQNMMSFVTSVYDCHLSEIRKSKNKKKDTEENQNVPKNNKCKLCEIHNILNNYECLIFNKTIHEESNITDGLAIPSYEICLIKILFHVIKSKEQLVSLTPSLDKHLESLENLELVCKKSIKFWIEIEYTVKVYDELDMCKMRISIRENEEDTSNFRIAQYEINDVFAEQQLNLNTAQQEFTLKLARLKYIKHLENNSILHPCPICRCEDDDKYAVLECGHHICLLCLRTSLHYNKQQKMSCPVCRNQQNSNKFYYVNRINNSKTDDGIIVKGDYSSKITYITHLILQMKQSVGNQNAHEAPKILIFSQWLPILTALSIALKENNIQYRLEVTPKTIEDFKNFELGITCLLMPLAQGSKGLNLIEATHVFLVEPILNPGEELQAIGRIHRFGQTKPTTVHRFIIRNTIEENIFHVVVSGKKSQENWAFDNMTVDSLKDLFTLKNEATL